MIDLSGRKFEEKNRRTRKTLPFTFTVSSLTSYNCDSAGYRISVLDHRGVGDDAAFVLFAESQGGRRLELVSPEAGSPERGRGNLEEGSLRRGPG